MIEGKLICIMIIYKVDDNHLLFVILLIGLWDTFQYRGLRRTQNTVSIVDIYMLNIKYAHMLMKTEERLGEFKISPNTDEVAWLQYALLIAIRIYI